MQSVVKLKNKLRQESMKYNFQNVSKWSEVKACEWMKSEKW